jgi:hypothetical protein
MFVAFSVTDGWQSVDRQRFRKALEGMTKNEVVDQSVRG